MKQLVIPARVYHGKGALSQIGDAASKRAMIVTDKNMVKLGCAEKVAEKLRANGTAVAFFSDIEPNPTRTTVEKGVEAMQAFQPDCLIGLGGGSAIDTAKAMRVFYEVPDMTWDRIFKQLPPFSGKARFIAIPSTSGTGTEASRGAVITNDTVTPHVKQALGSFELVADEVILDPEICLTVPPAVTADTGLDVLAHALEGYVAQGADEITNALAVRAIQLVFQWLPETVQNGSNIEAREKMHIASFMGGVVLNHAGLGVMHSLAHQLSGAWGLPHGRSAALMMVHAMRYNAEIPIVAARYADVGAALGITGDTNESIAAGLIERVRTLIADVGIPSSIKDSGVAENDFMANLDSICENAHHDDCLPSNPRGADIQDLKALFLSAWNGEQSHE